MTDRVRKKNDRSLQALGPVKIYDLDGIFLPWLNAHSVNVPIMDSHGNVVHNLRKRGSLSRQMSCHRQGLEDIATPRLSQFPGRPMGDDAQPVNDPCESRSGGGLSCPFASLTKESKGGQDTLIGLPWTW